MDIYELTIYRGNQRQVKVNVQASDLEGLREAARIYLDNVLRDGNNFQESGQEIVSAFYPYPTKINAESLAYVYLNFDPISRQWQVFWAAEARMQAWKDYQKSRELFLDSAMDGVIILKSENELKSKKVPYPT